MNYLGYKSVKSTETTVYLILDNDSLVVARLSDEKWRSTHEDFSVTSKNLEEIKSEIHHQAVQLQDQDLQKLFTQLESLKEEILQTPAFVLAKQGTLNTLQEYINLGLDSSENSAQWSESFKQEQKQFNKINEELSKLPNYHKLFQQVFRSLNPKATRNVFEVNTKLFLSDLLVKDLSSLPEVESVDYISKAFFRKEQDSVQSIIADLA